MTLFPITKKLVDAAELETIRAEAADDAANNGQANFQAIQLGERDKHLARAEAFSEAAKIALAFERTTAKAALN